MAFLATMVTFGLGFAADPCREVGVGSAPPCLSFPLCETSSSAGCHAGTSGSSDSVDSSSGPDVTTSGCLETLQKHLQASKREEKRQKSHDLVRLNTRSLGTTERCVTERLPGAVTPPKR